MKDFDLQAALSGEPVQLRDGSKAVVLLDYRDLNSKYGIDCSSEYSLEGWIVSGAKAKLTWTATGEHYKGDKSCYDIVGMWEEPPATITIGDMEVPAPMIEEPKFGEVYWTMYLEFPCGTSRNVLKRGWSNSIFDNHLLDAGMAFKTKEDAEKAHAALRALMKQQLEKVKEQKK